MTKEEVNQLLALMKANYSYAFKNMSRQDKYLLVNTWAITLQDINADVVFIAVMQLISESKWLPTVAEIRQKCRDLYYAASAPDSLTECMLREGALSPEAVAAYKEQRAREQYIVNATSHLRGDKPPTLKLDAILGNSNFAALGDGRAGRALLAGARYNPDDEWEDEG